MTETALTCRSHASAAVHEEPARAVRAQLLGPGQELREPYDAEQCGGIGRALPDGCHLFSTAATFTNGLGA